MSKKIPRGSEDLICRWHKKPMSEVCHTCDHWMQVRGRNPNTGEDIDDWKCADSWSPIFLMSLVQKINELGAAVESMRNESVKAHQETMAVSYGARLPLLREASDMRLIEAKKHAGND